MSASRNEWKDHYRKALRGWGDFGWPFSSFQSHVDRVVTSNTRFHEDLYASGAAGYRIPEAWAAIDRRFRFRAIQSLSRFRSSRQDPEDLWQIAVERLSGDASEFDVSDEQREEIGGSPAAIVKFAGESPLLGYFLIVARRQANSDIKKKHPLAADPSRMPDPPVHQPEETLDQERRREVREAVERVVALWPVNWLVLYVAVVDYGQKQSAVARTLNKDPATITRWLQEMSRQVLTAAGFATPDPAEHASPAAGCPSSSELAALAAETKRAVQNRSASPSSE